MLKISKMFEKERQAEINFQRLTNRIIHQAEKLNQQETHSDALSEPQNDDPKFKSQYE